MEMSGQLHALATILPAKNSIESEAGQTVLEKRKFLTIARIRTQDHSARS
jgi:hypothetical protein